MESKKKITGVHVISTNTEKDIYEYALRKLEATHENKRHIEIKSLSVLQACAISITLFTGLLNYDDKLPNEIQCGLIGIKIFFYITTITSIVCLLISLDDAIANRFKKDKRGMFQETLPAWCVYNLTKKNPSEFYQRIINDLSFSAGSLGRIIFVKNKFLKFGVRTFILSIVLLIIMGFLIA